MSATPGSKICLATLVDIIDATQLALSTSDTHKAAFFDSSLAVDAETFSAYGVAPFNAGETSGGGYSAGGATYFPTWAIQTGAGMARWTSSGISISNVTDAIQWMLMYDDTLAGNNAVYACDFGASYSLTAETLNVNPDTNGWFRIPA